VCAYMCIRKAKHKHRKSRNQRETENARDDDNDVYEEEMRVSNLFLELMKLFCCRRYLYLFKLLINVMLLSSCNEKSRGMSRVKSHSCSILETIN
jgi:hypothetical protein